MKKFIRLFVKNGQTTPIGGLVAIMIALVSIVLVIGFRLNNMFGWSILVISGVVIFIFGVAGKAEALGLKPFTNDPLDWRRAKETYKEGDKDKPSAKSND